MVLPEFNFIALRKKFNSYVANKAEIQGIKKEN